MKRVCFILLIMILLLSAIDVFARYTAKTKIQWLTELPEGVIVLANSSPQIMLDLPTASTIYFTDGNTIKISTQSLVTNGTTYTLAATDYSDIGVPRNVTCVINFIGAGVGTTTVTGSLNVSGRDQFGSSVTETVAISTNAAVGVYAYSHISTYTFSSVTISGRETVNDAEINIGTGDVIGLANNIVYSNDMIKVLEAGSVSTTYTLNYTYNTINFATDGNGGNDYILWYKIKVLGR